MANALDNTIRIIVVIISFIRDACVLFSVCLSIFRRHLKTHFFAKYWRDVLSALEIFNENAQYKLTLYLRVRRASLTSILAFHPLAPEAVSRATDRRKCSAATKRQGLPFARSARKGFIIYWLVMHYLFINELRLTSPHAASLPSPLHATHDYRPTV